MSKRLPCLLAAALAAFVLVTVEGGEPPDVRAQDAQYWTTQYGNRARMLGGAVIGSADDVSAVFYNPGALALNADRELLLAGDVVEYTGIALRGVGTDDRAIRHSSFAGVPSLFAGEFRADWLGSARLAYSFLSRQSMDVRLQQRGPLLDPGTPPEFAQLAGDLRIEQHLSEYWGGVTWARPFGRRLGVGVTTFVAVRSHRWSGQTTVQASNTQGAAAIALVGGQFEYTHVRVLAKVGLGYETGPFTVGLTVTTPGLSLFGWGETGMDRSLVTQDLDGDGTSISEIVTGHQDELDAEFRSPVSVGVGGSYRYSSTRLHAALEWFDAVKRFRVLDADPVTGAGRTFSTDVTYGAHSVTNVAAGIEKVLTTTSVYAGFRTDFSTIDPYDRSSAAIASWNLYHVSFGATLELGRSDFTVGGIYAFGRKDVPFFATAPAPEEEPVLTGPETSQAVFRRVTVVLGYKIRFG